MILLRVKHLLRGFNIKKIKIRDYIFYAIIIFIIAQRLPGILDNYEKEGKSVNNFEYELLDGAKESLYAISGRKILVFWATWCPPCKVELQRLHKAITNGELAKDKVLVVNIAEKKSDVLKYYQKNKFSFRTAMDYNSVISRQLNVSGTPTIVHIDEKNLIDHIGVGISPLLIYRAKFFLD